MKPHATWLLGVGMTLAGCSSSTNGAGQPTATHDAAAEAAPVRRSPGEAGHDAAVHSRDADSKAHDAGEDVKTSKVGSSDGSSPDAPASDAAPAPYAITAQIALTKDADGQHVSFPTQNGSTVAIAVSDLVGKTVYWATTPEGVPVANDPMPIDVGTSTLAADLTTTFTTGAHYPTGAYELACVISVTGTPPPNIPAAGDLAAFDNSPPPAGEKPDTGQSVRVHVKGANLTVTLDNPYFIRFGT